MGTSDPDLKDVLAYGVLLAFGVPVLVSKLPTMSAAGRWLVDHDVLTTATQSIVTIDPLGAGLDARRVVALISVALLVSAVGVHRWLARRDRTAPR